MNACTPASAFTLTYNTPAASSSFTVPAGVTRLRITLRGADGGELAPIGANRSGQGATVVYTVNVVAGDVVRYVVGASGASGDLESGGGGGTGVFINTTLVAVAGAGGGADNTGNGGGGQAGTSGSNGGPLPGTIGVGGNGGGGGNAGGTAAPVGDGGAGGGGILTAGGNVASAGASLTTGGGRADTVLGDGLTPSAGGTSNQTTDPAGADGRGASGGSGFGGGGAASHRESGAGGGYSGGGGGGSGGRPGGGGSFANTAYAGHVANTITAGTDGGGAAANGFVTLEYATITVNKVSNINVGTFNFTSPNISVPVSATTVTSGVSASSGVRPLSVFSTATVVTETAVAGYTLASIVCSGLGAGTATNNLAARTVTLNVAATAPGNDIICTYTNNWVGPFMTIQKSANTAGPVLLGQVITYTYVVRNTGQITMSNVLVNDIHGGFGVDPVPGSDFLLTDARPLGNSPDGQPAGVWGTLSPGDAVRFTGNYTVTQADIDNLQ